MPAIRRAEDGHAFTRLVSAHIELQAELAEMQQRLKIVTAKDEFVEAAEWRAARPAHDPLQRLDVMTQAVAASIKMASNAGAGPDLQKRAAEACFLLHDIKNGELGSELLKAARRARPEPKAHRPCRRETFELRILLKYLVQARRKIDGRGAAEEKCYSDLASYLRSHSLGIADVLPPSTKKDGTNKRDRFVRRLGDYADETVFDVGTPAYRWDAMVADSVSKWLRDQKPEFVYRILFRLTCDRLIRRDSELPQC